MTTEVALARLVALGFRRPVSDATLGGDGRIDIYLKNLSGADGSTVSDVCTAGRCSGHAITENDYVGYAYSSQTEAIRSVVPHELFHLVQYAYSMGQNATWSEGTAVWAVEHLYGAGNSDFERFVPGFLTKTFRPFERPVGGFGDNFPYGSALWPYYLEQVYGPELVVDAWIECENAPFLDAIGVSLTARGSSIDAAWTEFTRWNLFTGPRMTTAGGYPEPRAWVEAPREAALTAAAKVYVEGYSARYVPVVVTEPSRITVAPTSGIRVAAWIVPGTGGLADGVELVADGALLGKNVEPGTYMLVVTGLSRGTITTAVDLAIGPPVEEEEIEDDGSGCATSSPGLAIVVVLAGLRGRRRRR